VRPGSEVHVANGALRDDEAGQHLGQVIRGDAVPVAGVQQRALRPISGCHSEVSLPQFVGGKLTNGAMNIPSRSAMT
jgi:hypothetical protein